MSFEMEYKDAIQRRLVADYEKNTDKADYEGSFARDVINANSIEFENIKAEMNLAIEAAFADTSWGEYLTMRGAEYGIDRKQATKAVGEITITGAQGMYVAKGSLFGVKDGETFSTDEDCIISANGTVTTKITCTNVGTAGNVQANTITVIPINISGVTSVTNANATHDGFDRETDEEFLKRYKVTVRAPATSGNKYHYYNWAMSIPGVGGVRVVPLWNGAGTVKVIIVNSDMQSASNEIVKAVADYIETVRPIGATVTVISPAPKALNITCDVIGKVDIASFTSNVNKYIQSRNLDLTYISEAQVGNILMQQNITDYRNLKLNGTDKVEVKDTELLNVGTVTINQLTTFGG